MKVTGLQAFGLAIGTVLVGGAALIGLGNWLGPWWAVGGFGVLLGAGIWFYNYDNNKEKCPKQ